MSIFGRDPGCNVQIGLLTCDLSHRHGWAHYSLSLLQALRRAGVSITVVAARNTPDAEGVDLHRLLPSTYPAERGLLTKMLRATPAIRAVLKGCNLLHATIEPYAPAGAWAAGERPLFVTAHGSYITLLPQRRWPAGALYRRAFQRARVVCVSRYTETAAQTALPGLETRVVNNGVDIERFAQLPPLDAPKQGPTVLSVGAVKARKGTLALVQAMAEVRKTIPAAHCVIIGSLDAEPAYTARVRDEIDRLQLGACVHLLGHVPENALMRWYGAADVFALPSLNIDGKFEGYGIAHMEASAAGLPVIGTRECGAEDAIEDGVTGLLISQHGVTGALADALIRLLADPERARKMGAAGKRYARERTWDHVAQRMIRVYEEALKP